MNLDLDFVRFAVPGLSRTLAGGVRAFRERRRFLRVRPDHRLARPLLPPDQSPALLCLSRSSQAGEQMDAARARLADWLNAGQDEIHFGPSTSQNTFVLAQALRRHLKPGDEVVVTNQDHEANVGAYCPPRGGRHRGTRMEGQPSDRRARAPGSRGLLGPRTRARRVHALLERRRQHQCRARVRRPRPPRRRLGLRRRRRLLAAWHAGPCASSASTPTISPSTRYTARTSARCSCAARSTPRCPTRDISSTTPCPTSVSRLPGPTMRRSPPSTGVMDYMDAVADQHGQGGKPAQERAAGVRAFSGRTRPQLLQPLLDFLAAHPKVRLDRPHARGGARADRLPSRSRASRSAESREPHSPTAGFGVGVGNFYAYRLAQGARHRHRRRRRARFVRALHVEGRGRSAVRRSSTVA